MERRGTDYLELEDTLEAPERPEGDWAVPEQYRVDDGRESSQTTVVRAGPSRFRRLPLRRAGIPLAAVLLLLGSLALIPLLTSPSGHASEPAPDEPPAADLGGIVAPGPPTSPQASVAERVEVPDVEGSSVAAATRTLQKAGLKAETRTVDAEGKLRTVLRQAPGAGERVARRSVVVLLVPDEPTQPPAAADVAVPDLVGLRADRAGRLARAAGLRVEVRFVRSSERAGTVVDQEPAEGDSVPRGSIVELRIAKTPRPVVATVRVPRVQGLELAEAKATLRARGLRWSVERLPSSRPAGVVLRQSERPGAAVEKGTRVVLEVSSGPELIAVPDVVGLDVVEARRQLEAEGFVVIVTQSPTDDPAEDGIVLDQSPQGGAELREGSEVTIDVGMAG